MKKSRKSGLLSLLVIALVVALTFSVIACNPTETHEHKWDNGTVTTEATYLHDGVKTYKCEEDEETKTETIPALGIPAAFRGTWYSPEKANKLVIAEKSIEFYQGESTKLDITDADGKNEQLTFKYEGQTYNVTKGDNKLVVNNVDYTKDGGTVTPPSTELSISTSNMKTTRLLSVARADISMRFDSMTKDYLSYMRDFMIILILSRKKLPLPRSQYPKSIAELG